MTDEAKTIITDLRRCANGDGVEFSCEHDCPRYSNGCVTKVLSNAAERIEKDQAEIERLKSIIAELETAHRVERCEAADYDCAELGRVRQERDAAVKDLESIANQVSEVGFLAKDFCEHHRVDCPRADDYGDVDSDECIACPHFLSTRLRRGCAENGGRNEPETGD